MLAALYKDHMSWHCLIGEEDERCGQLNHATIEEVTYRSSAHAVTIIDSSTGRALTESCGAVIALPPCPCGAQTFLKADHRMRNFRRKNMFANGVLRLPHARNLALHHMLYTKGLASCPPILPMVPQEFLEHEIVGRLELGRLHALWYTFYLLTQSQESETFWGYLAVMEQAALGNTQDLHSFLMTQRALREGGIT